MTGAQDILNADVGEVGRWLREGWSWWIGELESMVPASWRAVLRPRPKLTAEITADGVRLFRDGAELAGAPTGAKVALALDPTQVLTRRMDLPALPMADLRRMAALEIERLTPLRADAIHHDLEIDWKDPETGRLTVLIGVVDRAVAARAVETARAFGLQPQALGLAQESPPTRVRFDFLPSVLKGGGAAGSNRRRTAWWAAAGVLAALNLGLLVWRDADDVGRLRETVETQAPRVDAAMRMRRLVDGEAARRRARVAQKLDRSPLRTLDAATRALPAPVWVERMEWNGRAVRLTGFRPETFDVVAAIEASPLFAQAKPAPTGQAAPGSTATPFDVSANVGGAP